MLARLLRLLRGPYPVLPRPVDALAERWARLRPRVRALLAVALMLAMVGGVRWRVAAADARWGGAPVPVLVAEQDLPVGATPVVRHARYPPAVVPPKALATLPENAVLALPAPEGTVLTSAHVDPAGPAAGLPEGLRAVPFPVEDAWGVTAGGRVDVWVLGAGEEPAALVAQARPVLQVRVEPNGQATALVGLAAEEVGPATTGLALGRVLLAHAPPP